MKQFISAILVALIWLSSAFAFSDAETSVYRTSGFQSAANNKFTRVKFNAVEINVDGAWNAETNQWCPGRTGSADISAATLWIDAGAGVPLPDGGVVELFIMRTNGPLDDDYVDGTLVALPLWADLTVFSGPGNRSSRIYRQSIYVGDPNYCYSISVYQWTGYILRMTDNWPQVTWAAFRMN